MVKSSNKGVFTRSALSACQELCRNKHGLELTSCVCTRVSFQWVSLTTSFITCYLLPLTTTGFSPNEILSFIPSLFWSLSSFFPSFSFLGCFISHLLGKGNKRPTQWRSGALFCYFVFTLSLFCLLFLFVAAVLISKMAERYGMCRSL